METLTGHYNGYAGSLNDFMLNLDLERARTEQSRDHAHGGSIRVESEGPGKGAVFHVRLPADPTIA